MTHPLLGKHLFVIVAHPDDEGYLVSGTSYLNHRAGGRTTIICATLGEKGSSHLAEPVSPAKLKAIRKQELLAATKHARVTKLHILGFPDGGVRRHQRQFRATCEQLIRKERPDVIISFGPDGMTGHRDHIACWDAADKLAKKFDLVLYAFTPPPQFRTKMLGWLISRRANPFYDHVVLYRRATVRVSLPKKFKYKILKFYPSQTDPQQPYGTAPSSAIKRLFSAEYFARIR